MNETDSANSCPICKLALSLDPQFAGRCCTDPAHWQAAGLLSPHDYYPMAQIAARAATERRPRAESAFGEACFGFGAR